MEIKEILAFVMILASVKKDTCVNSSVMNTIFDIPYDFRLTVKFSTHKINSTRKKIGFSCTNYFRPIVVLAVALATAMNKFHFHSLRKKMINLILVIITSIFDCSLTSIKNAFSKVLQKSCLIMGRAATWHNII